MEREPLRPLLEWSHFAAAALVTSHDADGWTRGPHLRSECASVRVRLDDDVCAAVGCCASAAAGEMYRHKHDHTRSTGGGRTEYSCPTCKMQLVLY
eukprot:7378180-Prymnesium_polylepis.1